MITIIIATYNAEINLQLTFNSLKLQYNKNFELIVIDGGSIDNTFEILNSYQDYISYMISEKDNGIYDAMNKGIEVSKGKWLLFLGCDDIIYNENTLKNKTK